MDCGLRLPHFFISRHRKWDQIVLAHRQFNWCQIKDVDQF
jgi:hypothetical protein